MIQRIRVLIADDQPSARDGMKALLTLYPEFEVIGLASDGLEAVCMATEFKPDVILMDMQMPTMDGPEATRMIKNKWPSITIIALTMYSGYWLAAQTAGVDAILFKGFEADNLHQAILETHGKHEKEPIKAEHLAL